MKKHLMRIIAAAASITLAAAPCTLPIVHAESTAVLTASTTLAEASAVLIDLSASDLTDIKASAYESRWNELVQAGLVFCTPVSCEMDLEALYDTIIANAGSYAPFFTQLFSSVSDETLSYADSVFTITASIPCIGDALTDESGVSLLQQMAALEAQYGASLHADSSVLDKACSAVIRADFSTVGTTGAIGLSYTVMTDDAAYTLVGENSLFAYLSNAVESYAASLQTEGCPEEMTASVNAVLDAFRARLHTLADVDAQSIMDKEIALSGEDLGAVLAQIEESYPAYADKIPASAETAAQLLETSWNSLMTQINTNVVPEGGAVNLDVHEVAAIFDSLTNVTVSIQNGVASISGTLEDAQTDAVKAYYAENASALAALAAAAQSAGDGDATGLALYEDGMEIEGTAKFVEASFPLNMLASGSGDVYYNIYRTYTFSAPAETTVTDTTETSEESTVTDTTETSEETTVTDTNETSEETTVTDTTETSEETTVTDTTETSEETTVTDTTETSEETTVSETTETSEETTVTDTTETSEETTVTDTTETSEETTVTDTTETSEETTVTDTTETSEETTVTDTTETSEETTVTDTTETSEETTVSETTETSEETTVTDTTETSEETTVTDTTETSEETTETENDRPDEDGRHHCGRHHRHHHHHDDRHDDCGGRPEWDWTQCPDWNWTECPDCDWTQCPDWDWTECPDWDWTECPDCEWTECPEWDWTECPEWEEMPECDREHGRGNGGRREHFRELQEAFGRFSGMEFEGGMPCISLNR